MLYTVTIMDWGRYGMNGARRVVRDVPLRQAWRIAQRAARRGFKLYGGEIVQNNWGVRGGAFPGAYRTAVISTHELP